MKKLTIIFSLILTNITIHAQQFPLSETYFTDKYTLSPSYAGNFNPKFLFLGYRSDWSGIDGGPRTLRLSYNDAFAKNAGYGGKIVYDKSGIFSQLYIMGSYSYNLKIHADYHIMFGLSAGIYKNRLNLLDYYNDPNYNIDPSLTHQNIKSKLKFMSDVSALLIWKSLEAGFMFSNISFGNASYKEVDLKYNPLANFQFHSTYMFNVAENWDISPLIIVRGGKYIKSQFELASQVMYMKIVWASLVFRDPGVLGCGIGTNIGKGLKISYNFNFATNLAMSVFNNHEISIGVNIFEYVSDKANPGP